MAIQDLKISELDEAASLTGAESIPILQVGANKRTIIDSIVAFVTTGLSLIYATKNQVL